MFDNIKKTKRFFVSRKLFRLFMVVIVIVMVILSFKSDGSTNTYNKISKQFFEKDDSLEQASAIDHAIKENKKKAIKSKAAVAEKLAVSRASEFAKQNKPSEKVHLDINNPPDIDENSINKSVQDFAEELGVEKNRWYKGK